MKTRFFPNLFLVLCVTAAVACDPGTSDPAPGDDRGSAAAGKADGVDGSCSEACGGQAEAGCWCDAWCLDYGDCCPDKAAVCDDTCPQLSPPDPDACDGGSWEPTYGEDTCISGYECVGTCPLVLPPPPDVCGGDPFEIIFDDNGCAAGLECISCPNLTPPPPDFCPDGSTDAVVDDETGCVVGFECN